MKFMFGGLLPTTTNFFDFLERHIAVVLEGSQELLEMMPLEHSMQVQGAKKIAALEFEADEIAHQCIEALHKTFITPFERNDIYRLITQMDDIIDIIEDIAARIVIYKMNTSERQVISLVQILHSEVLDLQKICSKLNRKRFSEINRQTFSKIHELENQADVIVRQLMGSLFEEEKDPVTLIKWKEIYENLEEAIDCCEAVANIVEGVIIENS